MIQDKQQIVFIQRALWGGGAEKVVYDIVHSIDRERFEPIVVHLFQQEVVPISYDPSIPVYCVEQAVKSLMLKSTTHRETVAVSGASQMVQAIQFLRGYAKAKKALHYLYLQMCQAFRSLGLIVRNLSRQKEILSPTNDCTSESSNSMDICSEINRIVQPIGDILPQTIGLHRILSLCREDAILVPVMEESTVRVWFKQIFKRHTYIASLHSIESFNLSIMYPDLQRRSVEEWLFANACGEAAFVITPSYGCRDDLSNNYGISPDNVRIISNPVNCKAILQKSLEAPPFEFPRRKTIFVQVARLDRDKNPGLLVDAVHLLKAQYEDFVVICLGKGAMSNTLCSEISDRDLQGHIILLGEIQNPYPYMAAARALILTSHVESFGLVLVEAMLCGAIPISVDCPCGPREILDNGQYGLLVPPDDPQALADAMLRIANDDVLYDELRTKGPARAQQYDVTKVTREWECLFDDIKNKGALMR
ncbi:MAG: glycosyltransferase [Nitrospirae bacterium]|nr:glycosyltransferase [Nitrospirota bacterium]